MAELAKKCEMSYEGIRKLVRGIVLPSDKAIDKICRVLGLDRHQLVALVVADKTEHGFNVELSSLMKQKIDSDLFTLQRYWRDLDADQKEMVIDLLRATSARNQARSRPAR